MERKFLLAGLSRPFVRLGALERMAEAAERLARARKAVEEIRELEDLMMRKGPNREELSQAARDIATLAEAAAEAGREAAGIVRSMVPGVSEYLSEAEHASD